ncbi:Endoplasmic reticulum-Golgi intermediate compartment protein 2 [Fasciola hepatica]|uniref:Endoplasmic reticulum-Golgi intermediate compartment protein 2 n=1 Tax=Fasciola hepatica TaxID=6192 RepID=A0A4E0RXF0_FASHE|nr:Endoplasmic reticulum-Golgi intermediate compartment protein 2 [Fasciola hepatica]
MEVRRRNVVRHPPEYQKSLDILQNLDVFTKLPEECEKSTSGGGLITIVTLIIACILVIFEVKNYLQPRYVYSYEVDPDFTSEIRINIDLTVATKCQHTSLDVLDTTGSSMESKGQVHYRDTIFELNKVQRRRFERRRRVVQVLRSQYHTLHDLLWKRENLLFSSHLDSTDLESLPELQAINPDHLNACHMKGTLYVRKVAGNMHIIPGRPITGLGGTHIHIAPFTSVSEVNFSHRINHLSFGELMPNRVDPLEAVEQISLTNWDSFHYKVDIVPTRVAYMFSTSDTYQYAATIKNRTANSSSNRRNIPGIFFSYDTFPLLVKVTETRDLLGTFLARLAALAGGLFATVGLIRQALCGIPEILLNTRSGRRLKTSWMRYRRTLSEKLATDGQLTVNSDAPLNPDSDT